MHKISQTVWVYKDGYPVKRFLGLDKKQKAQDYAIDLSHRYPGATISAQIETRTVEDLFEYLPVKQHPVKERFDV